MSTKIKTDSVMTLIKFINRQVRENYQNQKNQREFLLKYLLLDFLIFERLKLVPSKAEFNILKLIMNLRLNSSFL